ncbi:MAG: thymidylate synthase [Archaeoglobaceae archaeon]|nr:thymidylate synthase [Archaeoglobaceae archaeon]MDW8128194.1 thymidylate synthase [Archaeoglobaceae archaeon]
MILAKHWEEARGAIVSKILEKGSICKSRFGNYLSVDPSFLIVERPTEGEVSRDYFGEKYLARFKEVFEIAVQKLKEKKFTRRVSIPIWRPEDALSPNPPAITEISFLFDEKLHLTAYIRSLDCFNYFEPNFRFLSFALSEVSEKAGLPEGTIAMLIGIPHVYERDLSRAKSISESKEEVFGYTELGTHLVEDYLSSAWHSSLEIIYNYGKSKETEWDMFEGQKTSKFAQRVFIEVKKPEENKIHDKAPFTERYGIDYAHEYVICAEKLLERVEKSILKEGEEYTYAERARFCEKDPVKVDQLFEVIRKLKEDRCRRDCYVGISRAWDLLSNDPPCLRGYQFLNNNGKLRGVFYMRSNDIYGAMHANIFGFSLLTKYVAELTGFGDYEYAHFAVDAHIYTGFLDLVKEILYPKMKRG